MDHRAMRDAEVSLHEGPMRYAGEPEFDDWLRSNAIKHTDTYHTFLGAIPRESMVADHVVQTMIEVCLTYGFHMGAAYHARTFDNTIKERPPTT
jgi:hypothetical protein